MHEANLMENIFFLFLKVYIQHSLLRKIVTNVDFKKALEKESHVGRDSHDPSTCVLNYVCYEAELFARCSLLLLVACYFLLARYFLLVSRYFLFVARYFCLLLVTFHLLLVTFSHTCYPYLPSRLSLFSPLVLLKKVRTRCEPKISSCCFCVSCKSRELGGRGSPRLPCVTPVAESSSDLLRAIIS